MTSDLAIDGQTKIVGVWGHPVSHSRSPRMHNAALKALGLNWAYVPFDVAPDNIGAAVAGLRAMQFVGVNVTIPLKEAVLPFLDGVDSEARQIGSVNTIHAIDGRLFGTSTDGVGFLRDLAAHGEATAGRRVLVLGAGGSARAVAFALARNGCRIKIANRTKERAQELAAAINVLYLQQAESVEWGGDPGEIDLIINTTSLGMAPNLDVLPSLPSDVLRPGVCVYDLVYSPSETRLLQQARSVGCYAFNGLGMLVQQGAQSLATWTGMSLDSIPIDVMMEAAQADDNSPKKETSGSFKYV